jgi:hypothetical protein
MIGQLIAAGAPWIWIGHDFFPKLPKPFRNVKKEGSLVFLEIHCIRGPTLNEKSLK